MNLSRSVWALCAALAWPAAAHAQRFSCGSGDRGPEAVDLSWRSARARVIRDAVAAFCATATGRARRNCALVAPMVAVSRCPLEFYARTAARPAHVALGIHPARPEWSWYAVLRAVPGGWRVTALQIDDLEHP